jgi:drug/metabolite transporter (DMT)-like permease
MKKKVILPGYLFALGATALWSGNFIAARGLSQSIPPVSLAFWRWSVAVFVFLPFAARSLYQARRMIRDSLGYLSVTALLGVTTFNTLVYIAGHTTTAINLSLIAVTFPVFIILMMRLFYNEPVTLNKIWGITLVAAGVFLLVTGGDVDRLKNLTFAAGDIWMLLASFTFAGYSILVKQRPPDMSIRVFQSATFILGLIFLFPIYLWQSAKSAPPVYSAAAVGAILYLGVCASLFSFFLWNKSIEVMGPSRTGMVYYVLPVFSGLLAYIILGETLSLMGLASSVLILAGVVTANREPAKKI